MSKSVKLTNAERIRALAEARAVGCKFADSVVVEMAIEDKRQAMDEVEKSEVAQLRKRVAKLERMLGPNCQKVFDAMAHAVGKALPKYLEDQFSKRLVLRDTGVWRPDREYQPGDLVSRGGSGWIAQTKSIGEHPGSDPTCWRLAIKRGRDQQ